MPKWCGTRGANAASLTAPAPTGSWCATGCRCLLVVDGLNELSLRLGCRSIDGFTEREVYREFYPRGLTALDDLDEALGTPPSWTAANPTSGLF
jgi:hypothetical protein